MPLPLARIQGSIPPLFTPFRNGAVDHDTYARMIDFQIAQGSHGILVNGTTSEPASLTVEERNRLVSLAMEVVGGRVPVVASTGSQSLLETRQLTDHAVTAGVDALLIVTPYYSRPPQRGIVQYYLEATRGVPTPWMIYHIPLRAAISVTVDTVKELKEKSPTFIGMKHASTDLDFVSDCLAAVGDDFKIFVGLEELSFPMMAVGACGLMNAVGNLKPERAGGVMRRGVARRPEAGAGLASPSARDQQGRVFRYQSDPDQVYGQEARPDRLERASSADGARNVRTGATSGRGACPRQFHMRIS